MKKKNKWFVAASATGLMLLLHVSPGFSQTTPTDSLDEEEDLEWIEMMDDPDVNYFEAVKSFNEWKVAQDEEEEDEDGQSELEREVNQEHPVEKKKFIVWMNEMYPFVQADGSILPEKTRRHILKKVKH